MPPPELHRACLAGQIRDLLAERIASGDYPPGHRLVELSLAKEFGTSQAPVREALRMLDGLRIVETVARKGSRVRELSPRVLWESITVRAGLERVAAETGAAEHFAKNPKAVGELKELNAALAKAARGGDLKRVTELNAAFHRAVVEAAGNETLVRSWETFAIRLMGRISMTRTKADLAAGPKQHVAIIDALAAGDGGTAGKLLWEHSRQIAELHRPPDE